MRPATRYVDVRAKQLKRGTRTEFSFWISEPVIPMVRR